MTIQAQKRAAVVTTFVVIAVTVSVIVVGKIVVPQSIEAAFPSGPSAPAPARPAYGSIYHLEDPDPNIRSLTIQSLAKLNPGNPHVFRQIAALLKNDADANVRLEVAVLLATSQQFTGLLPNLTAALSDENTQVRHQVMIAISKYGPDAESAVSALQTIADEQTEDEDTRKLATVTIELIQTKTEHGPGL